MKKVSTILRFFFLCLIAFITVMPILFVFFNSFSNDTAYHLIPKEWGFAGYYQVFIRRPDYLMKFWQSILIASCISIGQIIIGSFAGYGFSRFRFPLKEPIFFTVIIVMMMPYQVTLVSNYIVLDRMNLIGNYLSIVLPSIFSPFGVFLLRQVFDTCPGEFLDAAKLDGAGHLRLLFQILIPRSKAGIVSLLMLSFVDAWNMVEQPLVFLKEYYQYPLSVFLTQISELNIGILCACGILAAIPVLLLYFYYEDELVTGITLLHYKQGGDK